MSYGWLKRTPNALLKAYAASERRHDAMRGTGSETTVLHQKSSLSHLLEKFFAALSSLFSGKKASQAAMRNLGDDMPHMNQPKRQSRPSSMYDALDCLRTEVSARKRREDSLTLKAHRTQSGPAEGYAAFSELYLCLAAEGSKVKNKIAGAHLESILKFVDAHPTSRSRETNKRTLRSFLRLGDLLLLNRSKEQLPKLVDHLSNNVDLIQGAVAFSKAWLTARSRLGDRITNCPKLPDAYGKAFDCFAVGVLGQLTFDDDEAPLIVSEFKRLNKEVGTELKAANSFGKTTTILQPPPDFSDGEMSIPMPSDTVNSSTADNETEEPFIELGEAFAAESNLMPTSLRADHCIGQRQ